MFNWQGVQDCGFVSVSYTHLLRPLRTVERGNECLENLVKAVEERGVVVDRPTPLQWNQAIGTPDFRNDSMMTCMPPRDILLTRCV